MGYILLTTQVYTTTFSAFITVYVTFFGEVSMPIMCHVEACHFIADNCSANIMVCENKAQLAKILQVLLHIVLRLLPNVHLHNIVCLAVYVDIMCMCSVVIVLAAHVVLIASDVHTILIQTEVMQGFIQRVWGPGIPPSPAQT